MKNNLHNCVAWVSTCLAIIAALYITKNSNCLWAFAFPVIYSITD